MRKILLSGLAALALLMLGGCATDYGLTRVKATLEDGELSSIEWVDGKEKSSVTISRGADGSLHYSASDVVAFDGQKLAAEMHRELVKAGVDVTLGAVSAAAKAALGSAAIEGVGTLLGGKIAAEAATEAAAAKAAAAAAAAGASP